MKTQNKTKKGLTKEDPRFDVYFVYRPEQMKISVCRLSAFKNQGRYDEMSDIDLDDYLTKSQFEDECVCWCDQHAA